MESLAAPLSFQSQPLQASSLQTYKSDGTSNSSYQITKANLSAKILVIEATLSFESSSEDKVDVNLSDLNKSLVITADKIVEKLNEIIKKRIPEGVEGLTPEEATPDKVAERIVQGVTALLPAFAAQNPELEGEALIEAFTEEVQKGVDQGYGEAIEILEGLGAFEFDGLREILENTKKLIDQKLAAFKELKLSEVTQKPAVEPEVTPVSDEITQ